MTQVNLNFEIDGEQQLSRFFELAGNIIADYRSIFEQWGNDFRQTQENVFASEGAFEGRAKWQALSPKYAEWKSLYYPGQPILTRSGELRTSLTSEGGDHVFDYKETEMWIGTSIGYAIFHQRGTYKMPKRKVVELTDPQKKRWVDIARQVTWEDMQALGEPTL